MAELNGDVIGQLVQEVFADRDGLKRLLEILLHATMQASCKWRSKTVARVGRRDFVALLDRGFRSFEWNGMGHSERRELDRSVYEHGAMGGRSTGGAGGRVLQA